MSINVVKTEIDYDIPMRGNGSCKGQIPGVPAGRYLYDTVVQTRDETLVIY